jgi:hypothetical protein
MKFPLRSIVPIFIAVLYFAQPSPGKAEEHPPSREASKPTTTCEECCCQAVLTTLEAQNKRLSEDLRGIKRDIAALNQSIAEPGIPAAMAGIGYIFGLFGVAAYMASRRKNPSSRN